MDVITNSGTDLLYMVTLGLGNQDCVKIELDIYRELDPMVYSIQMCERYKHGCRSLRLDCLKKINPLSGLKTGLGGKLGRNAN